MPVCVYCYFSLNPKELRTNRFRDNITYAYNTRATCTAPTEYIIILYFVSSLYAHNINMRIRWPCGRTVKLSREFKYGHIYTIVKSICIITLYDAAAAAAVMTLLYYRRENRSRRRCDGHYILI